MTPKTPEMILLETVRDDVKEIKADLRLFDGERLVLRTRLDRQDLDISKISTVVEAHDKKINYAMGAVAIVSVVIGYFMRQMDKARALLG